jgi:hypothetical protein
MKPGAAFADLSRSVAALDTISHQGDSLLKKIIKLIALEAGS